MENPTENKPTPFSHYLVLWLALIPAIWFMLTSWFWPWLINVFFSFPAGVVAFIFWMINRKKGILPRGYKALGIILALGSVSALVSFLVFFLAKS